MPELPDVELYVSALRARVCGAVVRRIDIRSPSLLRTFDPPVDSLSGARVQSVERLAKRIVFRFDGDRFAVFHLMIAGRLRWSAARPDGATVKPGPWPRIAAAAIEFDSGRLLLTEASPKKRATLHIVRGAASLRALDAGGAEPLRASDAELEAALRRENRTLKRALTDPRILSGIGNAYSDEILHAAHLSPVLLTGRLDDAQMARCIAAIRITLQSWTERLEREFAGRFPGPGEVTAFRPGFAVHGRFGLPCPACRAPVQRIRYAENETNYCAVCQNDGRILADRSLSRLLGADWPRTLEELEG